MRFAAALDPPAETKRQAWTLFIWLLFLGAAVVVGAVVGTHAPSALDPVMAEQGSSDVQAEVHRSHVARAKVAVVLGLVAPTLFTLLLARRHRRNGAHARGITVELTEDELRIWGRGYGSRVTIRDATMQERLVDVYAGRLGAWRQIRLILRTRHQTLELAAPAQVGDDRDLQVSGGEADCVEVARDDYNGLRRQILLRRGVGGSADAAGAPAGRQG
jgi:hypothetical protein